MERMGAVRKKDGTEGERRVLEWREETRPRWVAIVVHRFLETAPLGREKTSKHLEGENLGSVLLSAGGLLDQSLSHSKTADSESRDRVLFLGSVP